MVYIQPHRQGLRIGITAYKVLRARVLIRTLSQPYPYLIPSLSGHVTELIRTLSQPYPDLIPSLAAVYPNLIRTLSLP